MSNTQPAANTLTIAVAGATGFVGRNIVRYLLAKGHSVRALVRNADKAAKVLKVSAADASRLKLVVGSVNDPAVLSDLTTGAKAMVNAIGILRESRSGGRSQTFQKLHIDTVRTLITACEAANIKRFIQISAMGVRDVAVCEYQRTKFEGESLLRRSKLDWTILRPSLVHGPEGEFIEMATEWVRGHRAPFLFLPYFTGGTEDTRVPLGGVNATDPLVAPIAATDVARAVETALHKPGTIGEVYNLSGGETFSWPSLLKTIRDNTVSANPNLVPFGIPGQIVGDVAFLATFAGLGSLLPFDEGMARMGAEDSASERVKFESDFGFSTEPFTSSYQQYAASL